MSKYMKVLAICGMLLVTLLVAGTTFAAGTSNIVGRDHRTEQCGQYTICGKVSDRGETKFVLTNTHGDHFTVNVTANTKFLLGNQVATYADLQNGDLAAAKGTSSGVMTLTATDIYFAKVSSTATPTPPPGHTEDCPKYHLCGVASAKAPDHFILTNSHGEQITVTVNAQTTYHQGNSNVTYDALQNGMLVVVTVNSTSYHGVVATDVRMGGTPPTPTPSHASIVGNWFLHSYTIDGVTAPSPTGTGPLVLNSDGTYTYFTWSGSYSVSTFHVTFTNGLGNAWGQGSWNSGDALYFTWLDTENHKHLALFTRNQTAPSPTATPSPIPTVSPSATPSPTPSQVSIVGTWFLHSYTIDGVAAPSPTGTGPLVLNSDGTYTYFTWSGSYSVSTFHVTFTNGLGNAWGQGSWNSGNAMYFTWVDTENHKHLALFTR